MSETDGLSFEEWAAICERDASFQGIWNLSPVVGPDSAQQRAYDRRALIMEVYRLRNDFPQIVRDEPVMQATAFRLVSEEDAVDFGIEADEMTVILKPEPRSR